MMVAARMLGRTEWRWRAFASRASNPTMPRISFTSNLQRHVECPVAETGGATVRAALAEAFAANPRVRSYILDDQGALRRHVSIYVDGGGNSRRAALEDPVGASDEIYVFQALSGG